jgi:hypothetical protein
MADWNTVRELVLAYPEVEESSETSFRLRGKLVAWMSPRVEGALVVMVDREEKELLLESNPDVYFTTPHYASYPGILIRLDLIDRDELAERIEDAWLIRAPKRVAKEFLDDE